MTLRSCAGTADRTRERLAELSAETQPAIVVHGDLAPWNVRFAAGSLSGILDWEFAHLDHRVADFALSWRGAYDDVVHGYEELSLLEPVERALLAPVRWAWLLTGARELLLRATEVAPGLGWTIAQLSRRSPLMEE